MESSTTINRQITIRAPPPTPIATGKGLRSAVCSSTLTRYLETSLKVPNLTLPPTHHTPFKSPAKVDFDALVAGGDDDPSIGKMMAAAAEEVGWFLIGGDEVSEVGKELFEKAEDEKEEEEEMGFVGARKVAYRIRVFREKVKKVTCKLEMVAESVAKILTKRVGSDQNQIAEGYKVHSVICLRKNGDSDIQRDSHTLSLHIAGNGHRFCINSPDSTSFKLPTGSILVTIGKQFEELCHGPLESFNGSIFLEPSDDQPDPFWLEFLCSLTVTKCLPDHGSSKTVSIMDQLLILLILAFLYNLWS